MCDQNQEIGQAVQLIRNVLDDFPAFVLAVSREGDIVYHNSEFERLMGQDIKHVRIAELFHKEDGEKQDGKAQVRYEIEYDEHWYQVFDTDVVWIDGCPSRLIVGLDITDLKNTEAQYIKSSTIDAMTGIYNRQSGINYLEKYISEMKNGGDIFTICYLDINDLKYTNDTFGHSEGDMYINTVVTIIKNAIRQTDVFARMGGDEFLIIFPKCRYDIVDNIMGAMMTRFDVINETSERQEFRYSISYGIMEVNTETKLDSEYILNAVDTKMYYMKEEYRRSKK